jgi:hypothetical protein
VPQKIGSANADRWNGAVEAASKGRPFIDVILACKLDPVICSRLIKVHNRELTEIYLEERRRYCGATD